MNQALKEALEEAFVAPPPSRKKEFLRTLEQPKISVSAFIFVQIGYIRKWIWAVSALIFMTSVAGAVCFSGEVLWMISALTPLLALTVVSESGRSENYEMAELELATRFSLRSVVLARLGILGMENLLILGLLLPIARQNHVYGVIQTGAYILTPYLLTTLIGLYLVRRFRSREIIYACVGLAVCIGVSAFFLQDNILRLSQENNPVWWIVGVLLLGAATLVQYSKLVSGTQELQYFGKEG